MRVIDQKITHFLITLKLGLEWIQESGKELVAMLDENPTAFDDILESCKGHNAPNACPWLSIEVLRTVEAVGRGQIAPELLIVPLHVFSRLACLPPDEQIRAMNGVEVVERARNGGYHKTSKPACRLTRQEARQVIGRNGIRTPAEQLDAMPHKLPVKVIGCYRLSRREGQIAFIRVADDAPGAIDLRIDECPTVRVVEVRI